MFNNRKRKGQFRKRFAVALAGVTFLTGNIAVPPLAVKAVIGQPEFGKGSQAKHVVGEMFLPEGITPEHAKHLIDNSGMSGLEAPNHMHASFDSDDATSKNQIEENMYHSSEKEAITIDLGRKQSLGEMYIWNYNDIRNLDDGVKTFLVEYSENGTDYMTEGTHELGQCSLSDDERSLRRS